MRSSLPALLLVACAAEPAPPTGHVAWVQGDATSLVVGWEGPVTSITLDGPEGRSSHRIDGDTLRIEGLPEGTYRVTAGPDDPGLDQRVGPRLERLGHLALPSAADVKGDGDRVVVAAGALADDGTTATVVDIADPTAPAVLWTLHGLGQCKDAALVGRWLFLAIECGCAGDPEAREAWDGVSLRIVDLEAPGGPSVVGTLGAPEVGAVHNLTVHGDHLYLSDLAADAVQVADVSNPAAPRVVASWTPTDGIVHDQTLQRHPDGDRLLVATWKGLGVVDVADPADPRTLHDEPLPLRAVHQAWPLDDAHVLLTSEVSSGHLTVWRVPDDGGVAEQVGAAEPFPSGMIHNVVAHGARAYAAWYRDGLVALDVSDPAQPWVVDVLDTSERGPSPAPQDGPFVGAWGVWVNPESHVDGPHLVAVTDSHAGLQLVHAWPEVVWYPRDDSNVRPTD